MGSVRGVFRVPFVGWRGFHSLMYDPPLPPCSGEAIFGLLFTKGGIDPFNRRIFSYFSLFFSIFLYGVLSDLRAWSQFEITLRRERCVSRRKT